MEDKKIESADVEVNESKDLNVDSAAEEKVVDETIVIDTANESVEADVVSETVESSDANEEESEKDSLEVEYVEEDGKRRIKPMLDYESLSNTSEIEVPPLLIDQVIGHEESVETIKKAAKQRRNVLLIGDPGVGKSMLAKGMAELLPPEVHVCYCSYLCSWNTISKNL